MMTKREFEKLLKTLKDAAAVLDWHERRGMPRDAGVHAMLDKALRKTACMIWFPKAAYDEELCAEVAETARAALEGCAAMVADREVA